MYTVYILYSNKFDKIYIGCTSNLDARFKSHNEFGIKGWTIKFRPWEIVHTQEFDSKREALDREKQLKGGKGRKWIRNEIIAKH
ncbi:GIY-YIG nuclease family protein [Ancylomarina euxinus]|uniref:GIY-YIG nuclease family protein n=1 Tax=Ancylomarina euxinus TaxID=2283627 RepID=A0A425XZL2_9BACT|nr:GIY-YIG nuclease family protein [Ancylomarina euxinus]MCZ4695523.1 GIY-YIG nuclease family protein [Ancylomarina euxinus]MUP16866.1 GIY-YIG nuclease family protein [Ancylomarina euxinus]RRG20652.1 GIY-YIG nuclease family protein [Ancylomarina euxinus]